ncbi:MAG: PRC-barrel domain-containing protein, partial [Patescibacteria group bacterium]|nr:PRC-barrel domain-containing protein [Patescibacteria group bacterium]
MFIEATKLIGLPVGARDTQEKAGTIRQILVDPENGQLLGFSVQVEGFFSPQKVLSIIDIIDWDPVGLVTASIDNLVDPSEIVRLKAIIDKKIYLLGMKAKTESGIGLGEVENFLIDTNTQSVTKYYLKDLLGKSRILTSDKVSRIDKAIIFTA